MSDPTPNPIIEPELANRIGKAIQDARDEIGATEQQTIAFMYAEAAMRSALKSDPELTALQEKVRRLEEALTPSAATKAAYIGEFSFIIDEQGDDAVCEVTRKVSVPWTTIKEIMAAIRSKREP